MYSYRLYKVYNYTLISSNYIYSDVWQGLKAQIWLKFQVMTNLKFISIKFIYLIDLLLFIILFIYFIKFISIEGPQIFCLGE